MRSPLKRGSGDLVPALVFGGTLNGPDRKIRPIFFWWATKVLRTKFLNHCNCDGIKCRLYRSPLKRGSGDLVPALVFSGTLNGSNRKVRPLFFWRSGNPPPPMACEQNF